MPKVAVVQVFRGRDKQWYTRVRGANGRVLLMSEGYHRRGGALRLGKLVQSLRGMAVVVEDAA